MQRRENTLLFDVLFPLLILQHTKVSVKKFNKLLTMLRAGFLKNMILYKEAYGKERAGQICCVAALAISLDDIAKKTKAK
eukprot:7203707-Ditylum_brightwellii.AAC.1